MSFSSDWIVAWSIEGLKMWTFGPRSSGAGGAADAASGPDQDAANATSAASRYTRNLICLNLRNPCLRQSRIRRVRSSNHHLRRESEIARRAAHANEVLALGHHPIVTRFVETRECSCTQRDPGLERRPRPGSDVGEPGQRSDRPRIAGADGL